MSADTRDVEWACSYRDLETGQPVTERFSRIEGYLISDLWLTQYKIVRETDREIIALWPYSDEVATVGPEKGRVLVIDKRAGQFRNFSVHIPPHEREYPGLAGPCVSEP